MSAFLYKCALSRCEDAVGFPGFRQIEIRAFPQSPAKTRVCGGGRRAISVFQNADGKEKKSPFFSPPSAKWRKKIADRKAAGTHPAVFVLFVLRRFIAINRTFRIPTDSVRIVIYRIKSNIFSKRRKKSRFFSAFRNFLLAFSSLI